MTRGAGLLYGSMRRHDGRYTVDFDALLAMVVVIGMTACCIDDIYEELSADIADCEQALAQQDTEALRQTAHRIKGTSA